MTIPQTAGQIDWDAPPIRALIRAALQEDIGHGDATVQALVAPDSATTARILAKQELNLAGLPLAERVFRALDPALTFDTEFEDGARVGSGTCVVRLRGRARAILSGERTALNFLAHLSGIATLTGRFAQAIAGKRARIRDTRKTTPGLRLLEKYAVRMGGGTNHRFGLYDAILIKENHVAAAGGIAAVMERARRYAASHSADLQEMTAYESFARKEKPAAIPIQIEVRTEAELLEALNAGAVAVLLDNLAPADAARLAALARRRHPKCVVEISGGITLENVRAYAAADVDFISIGALTHSAPAADLTLLAEAPPGE